MKVVLLQLPVPDNRHANLPLALGYLKASADAAKLPGLKVELLDATAQNRGGDAFVLAALLAHDPDVVGFSLYTWNSSRSLALAHALKRHAPQVLLLGGGPEVNHDGDFILNSPDFDFLVLGEGERTFVELLQALNAGRQASGGLRGLAVRPRFAHLIASPSPQPGSISLSLSHPSSLTNPSLIPHSWLFSPPQTALDDVNSVPSVYLSGALEGHLGRYMSIELSRWCPSKCTFCYYGRQDLPRGGKRYFEIERVRQELLFGLAHGVEQVHFVEANFNTLPHLSQLYDTIKETGANRRMSFYAELRGEAITKAAAEELAACNFSTVEVGLQSAVPQVLAQVRRKNHLPRLVEGVHNLRALGTEVFLDVILGLPGDTPDTFHRTLDFVEQHDLAPYDLFHLQMLPGTQLKAEAAAGQHGMRWQAAPPYFVLQTADLPFETLCDLRLETLRRKQADPRSVPGLPRSEPFTLSILDWRLGIGDYKDTPAVASRTLSGPIERLIIDLTSSSIHDVQDFVFSIQNHLSPNGGKSPVPEWGKIQNSLASQTVVWLKLGQADEVTLARGVEVLGALSEPNPSGVWQIFAEAERPLTLAQQKLLTGAVRHEVGSLDRLAVFAWGEPDPARFGRWPSVSFLQLLPFRPELLADAGANTVWQVTLDEAAPLTAWQSCIKEALATNCAGVQIITPPGCRPARLKEALQGLAADGREVWLADAQLAAGLAYATAEDSTDLLTSLVYPLTAILDGPPRLEQPPLSALQKAALQWAL